MYGASMVWQMQILGAVDQNRALSLSARLEKRHLRRPCRRPLVLAGFLHKVHGRERHDSQFTWWKSVKTNVEMGAVIMVQEYRQEHQYGLVMILFRMMMIIHDYAQGTV